MLLAVRSLLTYLSGGHWAFCWGSQDQAVTKPRVSLVSKGSHVDWPHSQESTSWVLGSLYVESQKILTSSFKLFTPAPAPSSDVRASGLHFLATIQNH